MTILIFTLIFFNSFKIANLLEMAGRPPDLDSCELWRHRHDLHSAVQDLETGNYCRELVSTYMYKCSFAILLNFYRFFSRECLKMRLSAFVRYYAVLL